MTCEYVKRQSPPTPKHKETKNQILMKAFFFSHLLEGDPQNTVTREKESRQCERKETTYVYTHTSTHMHVCAFIHSHTLVSMGD